MTTMASNSVGKSRHSQTRIKRSIFRNLIRFGALLLSTRSCWRRTRISASREAGTSSNQRSASTIRVSKRSIARTQEESDQNRSEIGDFDIAQESPAARLGFESKPERSGRQEQPND